MTGLAGTLNFDAAPFLVIWEVTRACSLACRHCRAQAVDSRHPDELTMAEARRLIDDIAGMETPIIVFTGGDPLHRDDLEELVAHAKKRGLRAGVIPASTHKLTRSRIASLSHAGVDQLALSLDASTARNHDDFRITPGSFAMTIGAAQWAHEFSIPLQINTVLGKWNFHNFDALASLVASLDIVFWEIFFLVPTGRGAELNECTAEQCEELFGKLYQLARQAPFLVKVAEAPHYRRYVLQHGSPETQPSSDKLPILPGRMTRRRMGLSPLPVNAGKGFCFVSHTGEVYPSGFLPLSGGNVRRKSIVSIYRQSPLFQQLRRPDLLKGRCGACEYNHSCGGSRSRAYAVSGDYLAEDPSCSYQPGSVCNNVLAA